MSVYNGATISQHMRHIYDFNSLCRNAASRQIDYCKRNRNPNIEQFTQSSLNAFMALEPMLHQMHEEDIVQVISDFSTDPQVSRKAVSFTLGCEVDPNLGKAPSTVKYERSL